MIYLDNAATTMKKPPEVIKAVVDSMSGMGNASRSAHSESLKAARLVYDTRLKLARLFNCARADHVIFTANSTEALNTAINGALWYGDHVITTALEHNSVLRPLYNHATDRRGSISFVDTDKLGNPVYEDFERHINSCTRAIVCTHASNVTGNVVDIDLVGQIAKKHNLLFIVDASQSAGVLPIDMDKSEIDILCFTGHKGLMGPQGTGGLCIREGIEVHPMKFGGSGVQSFRRTQPAEYPTRLEAGTLNAHGIAGLNAAVDFINRESILEIKHWENTLMRRFYKGVRALKGVKLYGDFSAADRTGIVALNIWDYDSALVADELAENYGIAVRAGAHCAPLMHKAFGTEQQGAVRFSFSWYNTNDDVNKAVRAVAELASCPSGGHENE